MTGRLHAVVVTFRRPEVVRRTVDTILRQSRPPDSWTVVDNDPSDPLREWAATLPGGSYLPMPENLGPAGGIKAGLDHVLAKADDGDFVVLVDDDDPPPFDEAIERLVDTWSGQPADSTIGAIGLVGARFDRRRGAVARVPDAELVDLVDVDYLGGGKLPVFSVGAIRRVGSFDGDLFFGFDDLEYGLRLRAAGYRLVVIGQVLRDLRSSAGRLGRGTRIEAAPLAPWRRYYSSRNVILISRRYGGRLASLRAAFRSGPVAAVRALLVYRNPRVAAMAMRGTFDGLRGRAGKSVDPVARLR